MLAVLTGSPCLLTCVAVCPFVRRSRGRRVGRNPPRRPGPAGAHAESADRRVPGRRPARLQPGRHARPEHAGRAERTTSPHGRAVRRAAYQASAAAAAQAERGGRRPGLRLDRPAAPRHRDVTRRRGPDL